MNFIQMWEELIRMRLFWTVSTSFGNPRITLLSELRLSWFKMIWKEKKMIYNFNVLSFNRFRLHQGGNWVWSCCCCDTFECDYTISTTFCISGITLAYELRFRWFKMIWKSKTKTYNVYVLSFQIFKMNRGQNWAWNYCYCNIYGYSAEQIFKVTFRWDKRHSNVIQMIQEAFKCDKKGCVWHSNVGDGIRMGLVFMFECVA